MTRDTTAGPITEVPRTRRGAVVCGVTGHRAGRPGPDVERRCQVRRCCVAVCRLCGWLPGQCRADAGGPLGSLTWPRNVIEAPGCLAMPRAGAYLGERRSARARAPPRPPGPACSART